jgi:hypothetical protein
MVRRHFTVTKVIDILFTKGDHGKIEGFRQLVFQLNDDRYIPVVQ